MFCYLLVISLCLSVSVADENLARGKPTYQSSTAFGGLASRAVDGNTNSNYGAKSCTHTNNKKNQYWYVNLGKQYFIKKVVVTNRKDCCSNRLMRTNVYVTHDKPTSSNMNADTLCGTINYGVSTANLYCHGLAGQYVALQKADSEYLTLCEVQVYGSPKDLNIAKGKLAYQSSTDFGGLASRAVDGNTNPIYSGGSCTHTNAKKHQFWYVDLKEEYSIHKVDVYNRKDCCADRLIGTNVYVTNSKPTSSNLDAGYLCGSITSGGSKAEIHCDDHAGRYLVLWKPGKGYLTLCEVKAYGYVPRWLRR